MSVFEVIVVPDNPLMPSAYPPRVLLEADKEEQVAAWFKEAQEAGQYAGCHVHSAKKTG
jgi:hypothetical protein